MPIEFRCPSCQKLLRTPDGTAGKQGKCPHCKSTMRIPDETSPPPDSRLGPSITPGGETTSGSKTPLPGGLTPLASTQQAGVDLSKPASESSPPNPFGEAASDSPGGATQPADLFGGSAGSPASEKGGLGSSDWDKSQNLFGGSFGSPSAGGGSDFDGSPLGGDSYPTSSNPYASPQQQSPPAPNYGSYSTGRPHRAPLVFLLGLFSVLVDFFAFLLCCCGAPGGIVFLIAQGAGIAMGVPAWIMGKKDVAAMDQGQMDASGRGLTLSGYILGIVGVCSAAVFLVLGIVLIILAIVGYVALDQQQQRQFR